MAHSIILTPEARDHLDAIYDYIAAAASPDIAQQETEVDIDVDVEEVTDTQFEEDEEAAMKDGGGYGVDAGSTLKGEVNMGHGSKNKVGKLKPAGGAVMKDGGGYGVDAGSTLNHTVDMGKNNKVGNTKLGSIPGA